MGHLFRALVLADIARVRGLNVVFVVNNDTAATRLIAARGFAFMTADYRDLGNGWAARIVQERRIRIWVDDRLDTDLAHAQAVRHAGARLVTFDDRGPGAALADLNVVALSQGDERIAGIRVLRGLRFLVIDPAIARYRRERKALGSRVVTMGGSDTYGLTVKVVRALKEAGLPATVILGPGFRHDSELAAVLDARYVVKRGPSSLSRELAAHDAAITAGGVTMFEASAAGLPCIVIAAEPWERDAARMMEKLGACVVAGYRADFDASLLRSALPVEQMSRAALAALDANGALRVADEVFAL
jgi:spore coat polysaccharide biosynthesis predicted glycosyltransferase SpsG